MFKRDRIAIIPARGGSKRIPRKNILEFDGFPIISYSIKAAINTSLFDTVMVSTDDHEIADIAISHGAVVPFIRSPKNSDDNSNIPDVCIEVLRCFKDQDVEYDTFCCILPTSPLINTERIKQAFVKFNTENYDCVFPISEFSYPIQRALDFSGQYVKMSDEKHLKTRSQDLKPMYHDAGQFYWCRSSSLEYHGTFLTDNTSSIVLPNLEVQDIDNICDLEMALMKFKILNKD
jgi:pseudaminic acid cytidylyltransferase